MDELDAQHPERPGLADNPKRPRVYRVSTDQAGNRFADVVLSSPLNPLGLLSAISAPAGRSRLRPTRIIASKAQHQDVPVIDMIDMEPEQLSCK